MSFMDPGIKKLPGVDAFQQQLQQLIGGYNSSLASGGHGPFAQWAARVGKWMNNPDKQAKNPFESGGGGLFSAFTDPVTAAHGMTVGQIRDQGQNPLVAGQYQPIQQAVTQNALSREGDQYGMNLRGAMQQALGTAMGEYNTVDQESNQMIGNLLGQYGSSLKDVYQTPSTFSKIMQGIAAIGPAVAAPFTGGASLLAYAGGMPGMGGGGGRSQAGTGYGGGGGDYGFGGGGGPSFGGGGGGMPTPWPSFNI